MESQLVLFQIRTRDLEILLEKTTRKFGKQAQI